MVPRRRVAVSFVPALVLATVAAACSRTPPEPDPASASNDSAVATTNPRAAIAAPASASAPRRCITKLSEAAPRIPAAALEGRCPADPEPNLSWATAEVVFPEARGTAGDLKVRAELAKSPHEVERGLMYRRSMADDRGMLFKLEGRTDHQFWMHNTCIALDMLFIDDDGVIVGIVEGAEPLTDTVRSVGCPSLFVLETSAGWSRKHGVAPGQKVALPPAIR
jgi:uncharacterized membrane protein (UPF0127 family)